MKRILALVLASLSGSIRAQFPPWEPASHAALSESRTQRIPVLIHQVASTNDLSPILGTETLRRVWHEVPIRLLVAAPDLTNSLSRNELATLGILPDSAFAVVHPDERPPRILPTGLNQGQLIAALRDANAAALALRQPAAPTPAAPGFQMDPALMRRYGLVAPRGLHSPQPPRWLDADDAAFTNALRRGKPVLIHWASTDSDLPALFSTPVATTALSDFPGERLILRPRHRMGLAHAILHSMGADKPPFSVVVRPDGKPWRSLGADPNQASLLAALNSAAPLMQATSQDSPDDGPESRIRPKQPTNGIRPEALQRWDLRMPSR